MSGIDIRLSSHFSLKDLLHPVNLSFEGKHLLGCWRWRRTVTRWERWRWWHTVTRWGRWRWRRTVTRWGRLRRTLTRWGPTLTKLVSTVVEACSRCIYYRGRALSTITTGVTTDRARGWAPTTTGVTTTRAGLAARHAAHGCRLTVFGAAEQTRKLKKNTNVSTVVDNI